MGGGSGGNLQPNLYVQQGNNSTSYGSLDGDTGKGYPVHLQMVPNTQWNQAVVRVGQITTSF